MLASRPGGDRRPRHLLRPALRAWPDDEAGARGGGDASRAHAAGRARVHLAIHEAVLDPHGPVQQPDRAQVRAVVHAGGVRGGRARGGSRGRDACRSRTANPSMPCSRGCASRSSIAASSRSSRTRRRAMGGTSSSRAPTTSTSASTMADVEAFTERYPLNSRLVKTDDGLVEEVYRVGGRYSAEIARIVGHLEAAIPFATDAMAEALARARAVLSQRRDRRSAPVRHRVGGRPGVARGHDDELHRGLHGRPRREGRVGSDRLLRAPGEDRARPGDRRARAVVRGPDALGAEVSQAARDGRHRPRG